MSSSLLHVSVLLLLCASSPTRPTSVSGPLNLAYSKMAVYPEDPCSKAGGQCLEASQCPQGKLAERGLCPEQQKRDVECCYGVSTTSKDCRSQGGECFPLTRSCNSNLEKNASDCTADQHCCVVVV